MRSGRLATALALLGLGLLTTPAAAATHGPPPGLLREAVGHSPTPPQRNYFQPVIELGKQGPSTIEVLARAGVVLVHVDQGERAATWYAAHGVANAQRVEASFGKFGEISMRFRVSPNHTWERPRRRCRGEQRFVNRRGTFAGRFRFRGEKGYVSLRVHRARGYVTAIAPQCRNDSGGALDLLASSAAAQAPSPIPANLTLTWLDGVDHTLFFAGARKPGTGFYAETAESRDRLAIFRFAAARGGSKRLRIDEELITARTNPPAPFTGSGAYRAAPDGTVTWGGNLAVNFPGAPHTPLTGNPSTAHLGGGF